jgi:hypothetical protein
LNPRVARFLQTRIDLRTAASLEIVIVSPDAIDQPLIVADGNHRLIAQYLGFGTVHGIPAYVCIHREIDQWSHVPPLARALTHTKNRHGLIVKFRGIEVDPVTRVAQQQGRILDLTTMEFSLLLFFMRHPDRTLKRTEIYQQVWDEPFDGISNTLEVHIVELRRKLEAHGPRLIHTVRGHGYLFGNS